MKRFGFQKKKITLLGSDITETLDILETLRLEYNYDSVEVPGIVVTGSQSSGKSSVLQSISGIQLPAGSNITTRVPIIIRCVKINDDINPYVLINDTEKISVDETSSKILEYTNTLAGTNDEVSDNPLFLKVFQHDIPNMTLIDLPGITHLSVNNIQEDIHDKTVNLVRKYIANPNIIIICVIPSIDDFSNAECLKIASEVDPTKSRTIGVVTKVDLSPYDISDKLKGEGKNINLNLGFIGVVNNGPDQPFTKIKHLRKQEEEYFQKHYSSLDKSLWGTETLVKQLVNLQTSFLESSIPEIISKLETHIYQTQKELDIYQSQFKGSHEKFSFTISKLYIIKEQYQKQIDMSSCLNTFFADYKNNLISQKPTYTDKLYSNKIQSFIDENKGFMLINFININSFKHIFLDTFDKSINNPSVDLHKNVFNFLCKTIKQLVKDEFHLFSNMIKYFDDEFTTIFNNQYSQLQKLISTLLETEKITFTQSDLYSESLHDIRSNLSTKESKNTFEMTISLESYHKTVINRLCDIIPMLIYYHLVILVGEDVVNCVSKITDETLSENLTENKEIVEKRNNLTFKINTLSDILIKLKQLY